MTPSLQDQSARAWLDELHGLRWQLLLPLVCSWNEEDSLDSQQHLTKPLLSLLFSFLKRSIPQVLGIQTLKSEGRNQGGNGGHYSLNPSKHPNQSSESLRKYPTPPEPWQGAEVFLGWVGRANSPLSRQWSPWLDITEVWQWDHGLCLSFIWAPGFTLIAFPLFPGHVWVWGPFGLWSTQPVAPSTKDIWSVYLSPKQ